MSLSANIQFLDREKHNGRADWLRYFRERPEVMCNRVIGEISLNVERGEVLTVVGESGAGKTTLLRILCGLESDFEGEVKLGRKQILGPDRRLYLMPQEHTLLPWFTVERNLRFFATHFDGRKSSTAIDDFLKILGLDKVRHAYPKTLSGGERARVALACVMIAEPDVLLLDEPFRSLDQLTSELCQDILLDWLEGTECEKIVIVVSHSVSDAVFLGHRLIVVENSPLTMHKEFDISGPKRKPRRRTKQLLELEDKVFEALRDAGANGRTKE